MRRRLALGAATAFAIAIISGGAVAADGTNRPSHIHTGLCPAPGDVITPLNDTLVPSGDMAGPATGIPVEAGFSVVELSLEDVLAADHSIVVHHNPDDMGTYLVCGDLGGTAVDSGMGSALVVGLAPVGDSTYGGVALLLDNGDGTTAVDVFISDSAGEMMTDG